MDFAAQSHSCAEKIHDRQPVNQREQENSMSSPLLPNEQQLGTAKIFIVDDEDADIRALEWALRQAKFRNFLSLTDSTAARREFDRFQPDLVVLDINMPGLDGFEVLKQL